MTVISRILEKEPEAIGEIRAAVPYNLGRIARKLLRKDLNRRYQLSKDVRNDLVEVQAETEAGTVLVDAGVVGAGDG